MLIRGTYHKDSGSYIQWQASRLVNQWIGDQVKRYYLLLLFIISIPVMMSRTETNLRGVIWSDAEGYYQYLPGLFIIRNFHQLPPGSVWPYYNDRGEYVNKYTCGVALFEWPFFLAAYGLSPIAGFERMDYFNPLYCRAMALCGLCFAFLGLWFLQRMLLRMYTPWVTGWVLISVFAGTNFFHYATKEMGLSHGYNFFLFAAFLFHVPRYLKDPSFKNSALTGAMLGWIILIRPTNIIIALALLLYDGYRWGHIKDRIRFFSQHPASMVIILVAAILLFMPQLWYWYEMTGHWLYYSYTAEGFTYWYEPKITAVLFDTQNGLFLYSPIVVLMTAAVVHGLWLRNNQALMVVVIVCLATYFFASWWAWWFGGAFGHRCFVEYYALLAFPLAGWYQQVWTKWGVVWKYAFLFVTILLMTFSVRLSYLYTSIGGPWDGADWRWNWAKYEWVLSHLF